MISADLLIANVHLMTMIADCEQPYGLLADAALAISDGKIAWIGNQKESAEHVQAKTCIDGQQRFVSPGLIDCHTHLVWGGSRADEWERRLTGVSYEQIAREGGGILSTVAATRRASEAELYAAARQRLETLMRQGVTTLEIKSGYGLNVDTECKMLRVATDLGNSTPVDVHRTFLGAHCLPTEFAGKPNEYIDLVCGSMMDAASEFCEAVDVFCEGIGFNLEQTRRVFEAAQTRNLKLKVHAEQLSNLGGANLVAELGGLSADHLEYLDEKAIVAMAEAGTVAVLLPGAFYFIHETRVPPVDLLRKHNVPVAIATDANPGSSPATNLLLMANMACTLFRMTPEEAIAGITRNAAMALGVAENLGTLEVGKEADLVVWQIESPAELAYGIGHNPCHSVYKRGEPIIDNS